MEIPGINKDKINIEIKDKQVVLVTTFKNNDTPNLDIVYSECKYGKITRRIKLQNLVYEDFRFKYENGILKIEIKQILVEIKNIKLDDRLDDDYKTTTLIDKKSDTNIIDFKDLSLLTGDWADEPCSI